MKIALFSDIHANLPAFDAFLKDLDSRKADAIYCLGDLVGYNVWPNEIINEIRKRGIATLIGNHDLKVKALPQITKEELATSGKDYAYHIIEPENRAYLQNLPSHIKLEFKLHDQEFNVLMVHGSPRSVDEYVLENTDSVYVTELMNESGANILCVGHSHKPYHRIISRDKQVINIGSVGKPKDGNPQGCYVMLTLDDINPINVEFIRFDYDVDKAVKGIEESPLPDEFGERLREGV
ncbi:metallophosphoesterase [Daejeonella sp.]|uniref:metallophosphoesterase family protein n=1 Tax=Daejeonella sp. TaxID=2805397 RepID=UPI0027248CE6|nr:metallophosphoesterase family protein [Daejeonella sp.]MDO8992609.1 metallophosphoesterase family protein [Daejeonella sp.]MDP2412322.1 metallophosphoesterase family protein [Daejeonella sp.]